jgi:hypothetical protein
MERLGHYLRHVRQALDTRGPLGDGLEHLVDEGGVVDTLRGWR